MKKSNKSKTAPSKGAILDLMDNNSKVLVEKARKVLSEVKAYEKEKLASGEYKWVKGENKTIILTKVKI